MRCIQRGLAAAGGAVGAVGPVGLGVVQLNVVGDVLGVGDAAVFQAGVLVQVVEVLAQRQTDAWARPP